MQSGTNHQDYRPLRLSLADDAASPDQRVRTMPLPHATGRPYSTARTRAWWKCCCGPVVFPNQPSLVTLMRRLGRLSAQSAPLREKLPRSNGPRPPAGVSAPAEHWGPSWVRPPRKAAPHARELLEADRFEPVCCQRQVHSPNGTRCVLSYNRDELPFAIEHHEAVVGPNRHGQSGSPLARILSRLSAPVSRNSTVNGSRSPIAAKRLRDARAEETAWPPRATLDMRNAR